MFGPVRTTSDSPLPSFTGFPTGSERNGWTMSSPSRQNSELSMMSGITSPRVFNADAMAIRASSSERRLKNL